MIRSCAYLRLCLWSFVLLICLFTRTLFLVQTWSTILVSILVLNFLFHLFSLIAFKYSGYKHRKLKCTLVILSPVLTLATCIVYFIYAWTIYYRVMNLLTLNIMTNDRNESLLSTTLNYYQCCRVRDDLLFDSVNERDYFLQFAFCQQSIREYQHRQDQWSAITNCHSLFRSIRYSMRLVCLIDLVLLIIATVVTIDYHWDETDEQELTPTIKTHRNMKQC